MARIRRSLIALVALLSVLFSLGAAARDPLFCRMMGRITSACCCPGASDEAQRLLRADCSDRLERSGCCERIEQQSAKVPGARDGTSRVPPAPVALASACITPVPPAPESVRLTPTVQARAPPPIGPPLFLKHCSLLC